MQLIPIYDGHERPRNMLFPMPNDRLGDSTVVASVMYRDDDIALVLLLNPAPPFFTVAHYYMYDTPAEGSAPARKAGDLFVYGRALNIVPAVRMYEESGGDY